MWEVFGLVGQHTQAVRQAKGDACLGLSKQAITANLAKKLKDKAPKAIQALIEAEVIVTVYDEMNHKHYALNWYELERNAYREDVAPILEQASLQF
jgi:hypothetical protein